MRNVMMKNRWRGQTVFISFLVKETSLVKVMT